MTMDYITHLISLKDTEAAEKYIFGVRDSLLGIVL